MIMDPDLGGSKTVDPDPDTGCYRCVRAEFSSQTKFLVPDWGGCCRLWHRDVLPARQATLIKKKTEFSTYIRKSRKERLQSRVQRL
jgi:hypothetical protein